MGGDMIATLDKAFLGDEDRWRAVLARDPRADGSFFYSVRTTGVFCRPTCGSRRPVRENVSFHATAEEAVAEGHRPCRRCRPEEEQPSSRWTEAVARACRLIEESEVQPAAPELGRAAGMSVSHLRRVFKKVTGLTPKAYADAVRSARVRSELLADQSITDAVYNAGYNSNSRFYDGAGRILGMTPTTYRAGGNGEVVHFGVGECSLGAILVAATGRGVCAVLLGDDPDVLIGELGCRFPKAGLVGGDPPFEEWMAAVIGLVERPSRAFDLPLDIRGTAFQHLVWQALRQVPPGATVSYAELARRIGRPTAVRAVAGACAANHLAVAIPCHRVIRSDDGISGYRWGVERKRELLRREAEPAG